MPLIDALLPEFDHEMTTTRRLLERVPEERFEWKPHEKSMSLGALSTHLANLPVWADLTIRQQEFDLATSDPVTPAATRKELLALFDRNVTNARAALAGRTDGELLAPWTLKQSGHVVFTMPKTSVLRSFVLNHVVHHRGQLSVYLRLQDVPVPSIYGPSADEAYA